MTTPIQQDVAWKLQELVHESPKKDGSAERYLNKIGKSAEEYICERVVVVKNAPKGECLMCKQKQKAVKFGRIIKKDEHIDGLLCTDCFNVFVEYNPKSVFDLSDKETENF